MKRGTPKSLEHAIFYAFEDMNRPIDSAIMEQLVAHIKDYLAQKFCIAQFSRTESMDMLLTNLYNSIVSSHAGKEPTVR